jgi:hypothetical protein
VCRLGESRCRVDWGEGGLGGNECGRDGRHLDLRCANLPPNGELTHRQSCDVTTANISPRPASVPSSTFQKTHKPQTYFSLYSRIATCQSTRLHGLQIGGGGWWLSFKLHDSGMCIVGATGGRARARLQRASCIFKMDIVIDCR